MKSFRTLDLAKDYYRLTRNLKLSSHLRDQFLRSSSSIALNLAGRQCQIVGKGKVQGFYEIAMVPFRESLTILELEKYQ